MEPLTTLTIGGLLKGYAGPFFEAFVKPVLTAAVAGKVKSTLFPDKIQHKVKQHLDRAIDKAFPYKQPYMESIYDQERNAALNNLKAFIFDEESLELTLVQKEILTEWISLMLDDPDCFQLVESLKGEGMYAVLLEMLRKLQESIGHSLDEKDQKDADRHRETMDRLDRIENAVRNSEKNNSSVDEMELIELIVRKFKDTRDDHPSMQLMKISKKLFPEGVATRMKISARDEWSGKTRSMGTILIDSWKREKNHIMIVGEGGIGKTVTLLSIPNWFARKPGTIQVPAIYIPLYDLNTQAGDPIAEYIKIHVLDRNQEKLDSLFTLLGKTWEGRPKLLLLIDGFNEIHSDERKIIGRNIDEWAELSGIQIITSSRFDTSNYFFNRTKYYKVELQPLPEKAIIQYMTQAGIPYPEDPAIDRLISTPLMLNLYIETSDVIARKEQNKEANWFLFKDNNTAGAIIWNYLQCEVWNAVTKSDNLEQDVNACIVVTEFVAPFIAKRMYNSGHFNISVEDLDSALDEIISILKNSRNVLLPQRIKNCWGKASSFITDIKKDLAELLTQKLHILVFWGGKYKFMHQNFRDAMVAIHLVNASYMVADCMFPDDWQILIEFYVMNYIGEIASDRDAERLWRQNLLTKTGRIATINLLELQKRMRNCDFFDLDFSGLDLRSISLCSYLPKNELSLKMPRDAEKLRGTLLSMKSFQGVGHASSVNVVAITPDGMRCVSASDDKTLRIWDMLSGDSISNPLTGHEDSVVAIAVTSDSNKCISASNDKTLRIWNLNTGVCEQDPLVGHAASVNAVAITESGDRCISGDKDGVIHIWDLKTGKSLFGPLKRHQKRVNAIVTTTTENGERLCVSASDDGTIRVWNVDTGKSHKPLRGHSSRVNTIAISENGDKCVSASDDGTIRVWDIVTGKNLFGPLQGHSNRVNAVAITQKGERCISVSDDRSFCIWDLDNGTLLNQPQAIHEAPIIAVAVNPDGTRFVTASKDKSLHIWNLETGESVCPPLIGHEGNVTSVAISSDGRRCVSASKDRTVRIWSMETGKCHCVSQASHEGIVTAVRVTKERNLVIASEDRTIRVMNMDSKKLLSAPLRGHEDWINDIDITSDGKLCVSASSDNTLRVWDLQQMKCLFHPLKGHTDWVTAVAIIPGCEKCISASKDKTLRVWDLKAAKPTGTLIGHTGLVRALDVTDKGLLRCASASFDGSIRLWDLTSMKALGELSGLHQGAVTAVAITPDGKRCISAAENGTIYEWDMDDHNNRRRLGEHHGAVNSLAVTTYTDRCVSASEDRILAIWNLKTYTPPIPLIGHDSAVTSVAITPDDKQCVSASYDGTIRIWDMESGRCLSIIHILPIDLGGMNVSEADLEGGDFFKEVLQLNGAIV